jgi:hypothetical protein
LGKTLTNQNCICEETKDRMNSVNAFYHFVQNILTSSLLSKIIKIITYRTRILSVVLYGCQISSLTIKEEHRSSMFGNRVQKDKVKGEWRRLHNEDLHEHVACIGERSGA